MIDRRTIGVIVNPAAGGGRALRLLPKIVAALQDAGDLRRVHVTAAPGEATAIAREWAREGIALVVAAGGDGTVNEVANGLVGPPQTGEPPVVLGIVPAGRGVDFVRSLGLPRDATAALARLRTGRSRSVDVGRVTFPDGSSRVFVNVGGAGFDAAVAARAARCRLPGATAPYLWGLAGALFRERAHRMVVHADDTSFVGDVLAVVVGNGRAFGGGLKILPDAAPDDGCLDLAIVGDLSRLDLLRTVPRVYRGTHVQHPKFTHLRARSIQIESADPVRVELDGEVVGAAPVMFAVEPAALLVLS